MKKYIVLRVILPRIQKFAGTMQRNTNSFTADFAHCVRSDLQVPYFLSCLTMFSSSCALVVTGTTPAHKQRCCCTGESAHIQSNFRQNNFCTSSGNARDFVYCLNRCFIFGHILLHQLIQFTNPTVQVINMIDNLRQVCSGVGGHSIEATI